MAQQQVVVDLEINRDINGDMKEILLEVLNKAKIGAMEELDAHFGGQHWCTKIAPAARLTPPGAVILLTVSLPSDTQDSEKRIFDTFDKHWKAALDEHTPMEKEQVSYEPQNAKRPWYKFWK